MVPRHRSPRIVPGLGVVAALLLSLVLSVGTVVAADPAVAANPALVPFSLVPGQPGVTTLTFTANGVGGLFACGQDNGVLPTFKLGTVDPNTALTLNFPFIQAGIYTFWLSADSTCAVGAKLTAGASPVQATATRLGPTGKPGQDDILIRFTGPNGAFLRSKPPTTDLVLLGLLSNGSLSAPTTQPFPIPAQVCIMSGDGAQVNVAVQVGQDSRSTSGKPAGLGGAAVTRTVMPFAGQNGCFAIPWIVNGGYIASITRSAVSYIFGFCETGENLPSNPPTPSDIGRCAQVAFFPDANSGSVRTGTTVNGSIVTGADNHAVQVCVSAFSPGATTPVTQLANTVNAYNRSGAVNLTPLTLAFPSKTVAKVTTYDITNPGQPGGVEGAQFACPTATATQTTASGGTPSSIFSISVSDVPNTTIIDTKNYFIT